MAVGLDKGGSSYGVTSGSVFQTPALNSGNSGDIGFANSYCPCFGSSARVTRNRDFVLSFAALTRPNRCFVAVQCPCRELHSLGQHWALRHH